MRFFSLSSSIQFAILILWIFFWEKYVRSVLSPPSFQQNGFLLNIFLVNDLSALCTPLTTHSTFGGNSELHLHAC